MMRAVHVKGQVRERALSFKNKSQSKTIWKEKTRANENTYMATTKQANNIATHGVRAHTLIGWVRDGCAHTMNSP